MFQYGTVPRSLIRRGKVEGREEGLKEAAQGMLANGASFDFIQASTGLTEEQIAALANTTDTATDTATATNTQTTEKHNRNTDET